MLTLGSYLQCNYSTKPDRKPKPIQTWGNFPKGYLGQKASVTATNCLWHWFVKNIDLLALRVLTLRVLVYQEYRARSSEIKNSKHICHLMLVTKTRSIKGFPKGENQRQILQIWQKKFRISPSDSSQFHKHSCGVEQTSTVKQGQR